MPGTAIFDLDRTITRQPTWTRFIFFANRNRAGFWLRLPLWMGRGLAVALGLTDRQAYKRYSLQLLSALDRAEIDQRARAFAERDVAKGLRPGTRAAIAAHRARGDRLILATACCRFLAEHYGTLLGFDEIIATEADWSTGHPPPPRMSGTNCDGPEKLRRVNDSNAQHPFDQPVAIYSDHISDFALLAQADHGYAVNPSRALRQAAADHATIKIVDFDTPPPASE